MAGHDTSQNDGPRSTGARRGLLVWERIISAIVEQLGPRHVSLSRIYAEKPDPATALTSGWSGEIVHSSGSLGHVFMTAPTAQAVAQRVLFPDATTSVEPRPLLAAESAAVEALVGLGLAYADAPMWLRPLDAKTPSAKNLVHVAYELAIDQVSGWLLVMLDGEAWLDIEKDRLGFPEMLLDRVDPTRDWLNETCSLQVRLARVTLSDEALGELTSGDVLLPADWIDRWKVERAPVFVDQQPFAAGELRWGRKLLCTRSDDHSDSPETTPGAIDILFGELQVTMAELLKARHDGGFELEYVEPLTVVLAIDGVERGVGQLVAVEGRTGIRIEEWR